MTEDELVEHLLNVPREQPPGRCDAEVFANGEFLAMLAGPRSWMIEAWIREVRKQSGTRVDWGFMGGRAIIRFLGDHADYVRLVLTLNELEPSLTKAAAFEAARTEKGEFAHKSYPLQKLQWPEPPSPLEALGAQAE